MVAQDLVERVEQAVKAADAGNTKLPEEVLGIYGHGSRKVSIFFNTLCESIPDCRYLEFGTFTGRSLVAAGYGNTGLYTGVDKLDWLGSSVRFPDVETLHQYLIGNLWMCRPNGQVLMMDTKDFQPKQDVDVFFYDADHSYQPTYDGIKKLLPWLKPGILIVDDFQTHPKSQQIQQAVFEAVSVPYERAWYLPPTEGWHTGLYVAVIEPVVA